MKAKPMPPLDFLRSRLRCDGEAGKLYWQGSPRPGWDGREAAIRHHSGYLDVCIDNLKYRCHRIIWYMHTGTDPGDLWIDHINGNRSDNRICNLRLATGSENKQNGNIYRSNKSGFKGVWWREDVQKWAVQIKMDGKLKKLGCYKSKLFAALVYARAAKRIYGEFWRLR